MYFPRSYNPTSKLIISFLLTASFLWMKYLSFVYLFDCFEAQQIVPIYEISRKKTFKNTQFPHLVCFVIKGEKMERKKKAHFFIFSSNWWFNKDSRNAVKNSGNKHKVYSAWMCVCMWRIYSINQEITEPYLLSSYFPLMYLYKPICLYISFSTNLTEDSKLVYFHSLQESILPILIIVANF